MHISIAACLLSLLPACLGTRPTYPVDGSSESQLPGTETQPLDARDLQTPRIELASDEEPCPQSDTSEGHVVSGVVHDTAGAPRTGVPVELYRPEILKSNCAQREQWWSLWGEGDRNQSRIGTTVTDATGSWRIPTTETSELVARAFEGTGLHTLERLKPDPEGQTTHVDLTLPLGRYITGRVIRPPGFPMDGLEVVGGLHLVIDNSGYEPHGWFQDDDRYLKAVLEEDGNYRLGPLGPGTPEVALVDRGGERDGCTVPAWTMMEGEFDSLFGADDPEATDPYVVDFDLCEVLPGNLAVRLAPGEARRKDLSVALYNESGEGKWPVRSLPVDQTNHVILPALSGAYRLMVEAKGALYWLHDGVIELEPGELQPVELDLRGRIGLVSVRQRADQKPLAYESLRLVSQGADGIVRVDPCRTDENGHLRLNRNMHHQWLTRAPYTKEGSADFRASLVEVTWPTSATEPCEVLID